MKVEIRMGQRRVALLSIMAAWTAVLLVLALTLFAGGGPIIIFLVFTAMTALSVTFYWSTKFRQ